MSLANGHEAMDKGDEHRIFIRKRCTKSVIVWIWGVPESSGINPGIIRGKIIRLGNGLMIWMV